jgi:hypothetical protein
LQAQLEERDEELKLQAWISPLPPVVFSGVLVVPLGLIHALQGTVPAAIRPIETRARAARAPAIAMETKRALDFVPIDRKLMLAPIGTNSSFSCAMLTFSSTTIRSAVLRGRETDCNVRLWARMAG